jgi:hypothetical protein
MNTPCLNFEDWLALNQLYADYAQHRWTPHAGTGWTEFFTDDCVYRVQPRENHERGFPLATLVARRARACSRTAPTASRRRCSTTPTTSGTWWAFRWCAR